MPDIERSNRLAVQVREPRPVLHSGNERRRVKRARRQPLRQLLLRYSPRGEKQ